MNIGDIAELVETLSVGTEFITRLLLFVCVVLGGWLSISALALFRTHHENPKMMPLDRPITYLVLGLSLITIPFLGQILNISTGSILDLQASSQSIAALLTGDE